MLQERLHNVGPYRMKIKKQKINTALDLLQFHLLSDLHSLSYSVKIILVIRSIIQKWKPKLKDYQNCLLFTRRDILQSFDYEEHKIALSYFSYKKNS